MIEVVAKMISESRDNNVDSWKNLLDGIGDDCAVWRGDTYNQLAKVDCQVQGIHFNLDIISWEDLGWKALAVNLSDIASMGGIPRYALVSLGLPLDTEVENVVSLYNGMLRLAQKTGTAIVGGNMSGSPMIFIDVNVIGRTGNSEGKYLSRATAQTGDKIAVTGWLGTSAAGLKMLAKKLKLDEATTKCFAQAFARPEPRLVEGRILVDQGVKTGMDISDGLLADLGHICQVQPNRSIGRDREDTYSGRGKVSFWVEISGNGAFWRRGLPAAFHRKSFRRGERHQSLLLPSHYHWRDCCRTPRAGRSD